MISPASDTSISSTMLTGIHRKRDGHPAAVDQLLERLCALRAADEIDALVGAHILNAENRLQQPLLQHVAVERVDDACSRDTRRSRDRPCTTRPATYIDTSPFSRGSRRDRMSSQTCARPRRENASASSRSDRGQRGCREESAADPTGNATARKNPPRPNRARHRARAPRSPRDGAHRRCRARRRS